MDRALIAQRRRVNRARNFPVNTCPASRHLHMIADALAKGRTVLIRLTPTETR